MSFERAKKQERQKTKDAAKRLLLLGKLERAVTLMNDLPSSDTQEVVKQLVAGADRLGLASLNELQTFLQQALLNRVITPENMDDWTPTEEKKRG